MREYVVNRPDAGAMRTLLERESDPEGVIVRLAWLAGLSRDEIAALSRCVGNRSPLWMSGWNCRIGPFP